MAEKRRKFSSEEGARVRRRQLADEVHGLPVGLRPGGGPGINDGTRRA